jgi:hypothetical protein
MVPADPLGGLRELYRKVSSALKRVLRKMLLLVRALRWNVRPWT